MPLIEAARPYSLAEPLVTLQFVVSEEWRRQADLNRRITVLQTVPLATWVWRLKVG